eukprot:195098_1
MNLADRILTQIVISPILPLLCVVLFYVSEHSLFIVTQLLSSKLMYQYHCITSSYPTQLSVLFHLLITFIIGLSAWLYHLYDYLCLFFFVFLVISALWILALSNLYPYTERIKQKQKRTKKEAHNLNLSSLSMNSNSSFNTSGIGLSDSFFFSPTKQDQKEAETNSLFASLPFEMNPNLQNSFLNHDNLNRSQILNGSIINFNRLNETDPDPEINKIRKLSEPTNFFQGMVGFSSVHSTLNFFNIFDAQRKSQIIETMTKQNYFNLSSLHLSAMLIDLFAFILIPFMIFHVFLLYQSQHSMIPVCYVLLILFVAQYGENVMNYLLHNLNNEYAVHNKKNILSYSISSKYSLEGSLITIVSSCCASVLLYICIGIIFYGPTCAHSHRRDCSKDDAYCLVCRSSFVAMNLFNHIVLASFIAMQSIVGSLFVDIIIKSYSHKLLKIYETRKDKKLLIWLQRFSPFIFAFAV